MLEYCEGIAWKKILMGSVIGIHPRGPLQLFGGGCAYGQGMTVVDWREQESRLPRRN